MKTVVVDKDEIIEFIKSNNSIVEGVSYEWEGEDVVRGCINPLPHAFGKTGRVLWVKKDFVKNQEGNEGLIIQVANQDEMEATLHTSEESIPCKVEVIPSKDEIFSRSKGILEVDILKDRRVLIVGLGSFGSQIAIELAKAGVGKFSLIDFDRVEVHNLARHTGSMNDLGRLKVNVLKDAILGKNKSAEVDAFPENINVNPRLLEEEIIKSDLIICATDNNASRFRISQELVKSAKTGIFGRAITRAEGGDVFRYRPGGPCYACLVGSATFSSAIEEVTDRNQLPAYMSEEDANAIIQVGLSSDIEPICNLMIKLALLELSKGRHSGIEDLESELTYDYYMWANRRERRHENWAPFNNSSGRPTILRWYGVRISSDETCPICSDVKVLEPEDDEIALL